MISQTFIALFKCFTGYRQILTILQKPDLAGYSSKELGKVYITHLQS